MGFCERREEERVVWLKQVALVPEANRVYVDEAGVDDTLTRLYGWSLRGVRCQGWRRGHAKERVSMVAAWCRAPNGTAQILAPLTFTGSCDSELFELWFEQCLLKELQPGQVVILDNATFHRKNRLRPLLEQKGCRLLPLPAYSPDFNPIEHLWNTIKQFIRYHTKHITDLHDKVDAAFCSLW